MHMARVATVSGCMTSAVPSRIATVSLFPSAWLRWMFSTTTVALSTSKPTARAKPPKVIRLIVCPARNRPARLAPMDNGMVTATRKVLRQLPRKTRIINDTRMDETTTSRRTLFTAARTKTD